MVRECMDCGYTIGDPNRKLDSFKYFIFKKEFGFQKFNMLCIVGAPIN